MSIKCIVILNEATDGVVYEFPTEAEYKAFADGVREGASFYGARQVGVYTKDAYGKLPPIGNKFIKEYLIDPEKKESR